MIKYLSLISLLALGTITGTAQILTSTFQFTASGYIGTPATASTPFQGQSFTNAAITITAFGNTANRILTGNMYCLPSDSASVSISGVGTFQFAATAIMNLVDVDPIRFVLGNSIGFYASNTSTSPVSCGGISPVAADVRGSTAWDMFRSFGPFQTNIILPGSQLMSTTGGTLELNNNVFAPTLGTFRATFTGTPPPPTLIRTGILSHIAAGGGWSTVITLVNSSSSTVPVIVSLHNDTGNALTVPLTSTQQGISQTTTASTLNTTMNPNTTLLISMGDQIPSTVVGWADVTSTVPLGGYAIFRQTPVSGSPSEGTSPVQSQFPSAVTLPYDNTGGFIIGVALVNLFFSPATVTATIWDDSGNQLGTQSITIAGSGHASFALPTQLSLTTGRRGIVQFKSSSTDGIAVLGFRFSPFGTFTSIPII